MRKKAQKMAPPTAAFITPEERHRMIEMAAYYLAERANFQRDAVACWAEAEQRVDADLASEFAALSKILTKEVAL